MLTLSNNPSYQYLRKILVLPVAAIVIILFAFSYETSKNRNNESDKNTLLNQEIILADTTKPTVATTPKFTPPVLKKIMPGQKLVVINGQIRGIATDLNKLHGWVDMNQVESMTILKDESGVLKYGEMAKYGVIEIKMKPKKDSIKVQEIVLPGYNQHDTSKPKIELIKNSVTGETEALYNGRKFTRILIFPPSDQLSFLYTSNELEMVSKQESDLIKKQYSSQIENYLDPIIDTIYYKDGSAEFVYKKGSREKITTQEAARLIRKIPATEEKRTDIIFDKAETPPSFPGGKEAWNAFVTKNIDPDIATKNGAEKGDYLIWVEFTVDENGNINDLKPLTKTKYGMEEELVRTMKLSPKWSPARQNGYPVKIWWGQSVTFRSTNPLNVTTTIDYSSIPPISRKELTNADVHNLLGLPRGTEVLSFTFTIDLPEDAVTEAPNYGDQFSEKTKTLMQNAIAGNLITLDRIRIKLEGNEKKIGAKAYMVVD